MTILSPGHHKHELSSRDPWQQLVDVEEPGDRLGQMLGGVEGCAFMIFVVYNAR